MKHTINLSVIILGLYFILSGVVLAAGEKQTQEVSPETVAKKMPAYPSHLKQITKEAEKNIQKIDAQLQKQETLKKKPEVLPAPAPIKKEEAPAPKSAPKTNFIPRGK